MPFARSSDARHVLILRNPKSGAKDTQNRVDRLEKALRSRGFLPEVSTDLDSVTEQAIRLHAEGNLHVLVGVGGDGTAAELVNRTPSGLPITLLPGGNENLLARYLKLEADPEKSAEMIARGKVVAWDAGRAGGRIFLLMASCGLDAEVVRRVHLARTGHLRSRNYLKPLWDTLRTYEYPELRVYCDEGPETQGESRSYSMRWLSVFNFPCYGGGLHFVSKADGADAQLDLCGFGRGSMTWTLALMAAVYVRQPRLLPGWVTRKIRTVRIESDIPVPYQLDGDPGGFLPLEIEVLPNRLTLIVP